MDTIKADFKYGIGERVVNILNQLHEYIIIERVIVECEGGIQKFYQVRDMTKAQMNSTGMIQVHEFEIIKIKEKNDE